MPAKPRIGQHWLYQWMDEYEAFDEHAVSDRLAFPGAVARLHELATNHKTIDYSEVPLSGTVVAGPWLDTSSALICSNFRCQKKHVDLNYGNALHYFDFIMLEGPSAGVYAARIEKISSGVAFDNLTFDIANEIRLLQHARDIGLDKHLVFADKLCACRPHLMESAEEVGTENLVDPGMIDQLSRQISREGGVFLEQDGPESWFGYVEHPLLEGASGRTFYQKSPPRKYEVAKQLLEAWLYSAIYDSATAHRLGAPLASLAPAALFEQSGGRRGKITIDDVGARIRIPALDGMSTKDIILLRNNEYHYFERFQGALREAIAETLDKADSDSPEMIAELVWRNKIKPAVADIEARVAANSSALKQKLAAAGAVGTIAGTVGAVTSLPWLIGIGLVAAGTPLTQYFKSVEERQKIKDDKCTLFGTLAGIISPRKARLDRRNSSVPLSIRSGDHSVDWIIGGPVALRISCASHALKCLLWRGE